MIALEKSACTLLLTAFLLLSTADSAFAQTPQPASPQPAPSQTDVLKKLKRGVLLVTTFDAEKHPRSQGSAFLFDQEGYCITNFHVVRGAASAVARFSDSTTDLPITLCFVEPRSDLSVFKIDLPSKANCVVLPFSDSLPDEGEEVWALGYPLGLGYSVNRGVVNGVRLVANLPPELQPAFRDVNPNLKMVQHDCTINSGNSGGPLINSRGQVVGVNTWSLKHSSNIYFSILTQSIQSLLDRKDEKLDFADLLKNYPPEEEPPLGARATPPPPVLSIDFADLPAFAAKQKSTAANVRTATDALAAVLPHKCAACAGRGKIDIKRNVGFPGTVKYSTEPCKQCEGRGTAYGALDKAPFLLDVLTKAVAQTQGLKDAPVNIALSKARSLITAGILSDDRVNKIFAAETYTTTLVEGQPLSGIGQVEAVLTNPAGDTTVYIIRASKKLFLLDSPRFADSIRVNNYVVFGGLVGTDIPVKNAGKTPTVQGGFIVAP